MRAFFIWWLCCEHWSRTSVHSSDLQTSLLELELLMVPYLKWHLLQLIAGLVSLMISFSAGFFLLWGRYLLSSSSSSDPFAFSCFCLCYLWLIFTVSSAPPRLNTTQSCDCCHCRWRGCCCDGRRQKLWSAENSLTRYKLFLLLDKRSYRCSSVRHVSRSETSITARTGTRKGRRRGTSGCLCWCSLCNLLTGTIWSSD